MISIKPPSFDPLRFSSSETADMRRGVMDGVDEGARSLAGRVRAAAPAEKGDLRASVRVERRGDEVEIRAGGPQTTTTSGGRPFDHALASEFGTTKERARPFFYPTIRAGRGDLHKAARDGLPPIKRG